MFAGYLPRQESALSQRRRRARWHMTESVPLAGVPFANVEEIVVGIERMQESWIVSAHREPITCLCVHGLSLFSAGRDALLILYDLAPTHEREPPELLATFTLPRVATSIAADRSRIYAATGSCDIDVVDWSQDEGMIISMGAPLEGHTRTVTALAVHDGLLYSSANDRTVRLWDGPQPLMTLAEGVDPFGSVSVLHDRLVSTAHAGGPAISLWRYSLLQVKARSSFSLAGLFASRTAEAPVRAARHSPNPTPAPLAPTLAPPQTHP